MENDKIWWIIETENNISIALDARNEEYFEISE